MVNAVIIINMYNFIKKMLVKHDAIVGENLINKEVLLKRETNENKLKEKENKLKENLQKELDICQKNAIIINRLIDSNIIFSSFGWVQKASIIIGI